MPRAAVGSDHQPAAADTFLAQPQTERTAGQCNHARMVGLSDDLLRGGLFLGTADDQHLVVQLLGDPPGQLGEVFHGPELGCAEGPRAVHHHHLVPVPDSESPCRLVGQKPVLLGRGQLQLGRLPRAAQLVSQRQVVIDHRKPHQAAPDARRVKRIGKQPPAPVAPIAYPAPRPGKPGQHSRAQRIGHQHGHVRAQATQLADYPPAAASRVAAAGVVEHAAVQPRRSFQHGLDPGTHHSHKLRLREALPQRTQRRGGHHRVANPVGQEYDQFHRVFAAGKKPWASFMRPGREGPSLLRPPVPDNGRKGWGFAEPG